MGRTTEVFPSKTNVVHPHSPSAVVLWEVESPRVTGAATYDTMIHHYELEEVIYEQYGQRRKEHTIRTMAERVDAGHERKKNSSR